MTETENRLSQLFDELVPMSGKADTIAGEIVRAICRIGYRSYNDGDHIGVGYGKETCNPAARYLMARTNEEIAAIIYDMWGQTSDYHYEKQLADLENKVLGFIESHPWLKVKSNPEDMLSFRDKELDVDDSWMEDEDW